MVKQFGIMLAASFAAGSVLGVGSSANGATVLSQWTFETSVPLSPATSFVAEGGLNAASSFATTNTGGAISNPVGNGSNESFSSNGWDLGEYFQFTTSTTGYQDIQISFDQTGSSTGPRDFDAQFSTDGVTYTSFDNYAVPTTAGPTLIAWSSAGSPNPLSTKTYDLTAATALNNDSSIFFRLATRSTVAITNANPVASTGTGRVDNVTISGTVIPEPASLGVLALGGLALVRRRRA